MRGVAGRRQAGSDVVALEAYAESAGRALACLFSSSDEFEADLIRERRAAGVYCVKRSRVHIATCLGVTVALSVIIFLVS